MKLAVRRGQDGSATVTVCSDAGNVTGELEFWSGVFPTEDQIWETVRDALLRSDAVETVSVH